MSNESMKGYGSGKTAPKFSKAELQQKEKDDKAKREVAYFREVFGPPSVRSDAQKFVMDWLAYQGYQHRSIMKPPCSANDMYGRLGVRELYLAIIELANRPIDWKPKKPAKIIKEGFNYNTK